MTDFNENVMNKMVKVHLVFFSIFFLQIIDGRKNNMESLVGPQQLYIKVDIKSQSKLSDYQDMSVKSVERL